MEAYKPAVVTNVESAIGAMNRVVSLLQQDKPLGSHIIEVNYRQETVQEFTKCSSDVVDSLRSASEISAKWLVDVGTHQMQNIEQARQVSVRQDATSVELVQVNEHIQATEAGITSTQGDINAAENDLESEKHALSRARAHLREQRNINKAVRVASFALFVFAPIVSVAAMTASLVAGENAINAHENRVSTIENGLNASRVRLQGHRDALATQNANRAGLSARVTELQTQAAELAEESRTLAAARDSLSQLTVRINDCLHAVSGAMSSSAVIADAGSMRDVVTGLRGVADSLGQNEMFTGPLAQLDDAGLVTLTHRVAAIKSHQLTF